MREPSGQLDLEIVVRGEIGHPRAELRVAGEFDRLQVGRFDKAATALSEAIEQLTVDLSRTTIIDSAALGSLVRLRHALDRRGCTLRVVVATPFQETVLRVSGLFDFLGVEVGDRP
ncbi:STAS domain-containing protein [Ilumatobacter coccineus]|jgi:anti-anti-sigma factor|uniref:Putative anti-sigma factor antagonist n=1 Tax=Ilumatobacter coccineus (strain NBRC 103263 / KCTC 29153 / YM16-304) TaxID=1313172 RepID=A0A6C7EG34_ILUCY|nr:STAS domain-containing protein [Ilumatobacter coccineus]BAN03548.1 putative anti-sigma factor antagonist [Ilumatobacter coccineus YM16-304]